MAFTDLAEALRDPAIDAVYVASPVALHAEQTIASLRAGKQVLCEKPVALDLCAGEDDGCGGARVRAAAGSCVLPAAVSEADAGEAVDCGGRDRQPVLVEANYHGWLESPERGWLKDPALAGGGPLYDMGSHRIDACNFLFGKPLRATGLLSNALHELAVEDSATTLIEYAGGVHAVVDVRWNSRIQRDQFRVIGVEGEINLDPLNGPALRLRDERWEDDRGATACACECALSGGGELCECGAGWSAAGVSD